MWHYNCLCTLKPGTHWRQSWIQHGRLSTCCCRYGLLCCRCVRSQSDTVNLSTFNKVDCVVFNFVASVYRALRVNITGYNSHWVGVSLQLQHGLRRRVQPSPAAAKLRYASHGPRCHPRRYGRDAARSLLRHAAAWTAVVRRVVVSHACRFHFQRWRHQHRLPRQVRVHCQAACQQTYDIFAYIFTIYSNLCSSLCFSPWRRPGTVFGCLCL